MAVTARGELVATLRERHGVDGTDDEILDAIRTVAGAAIGQGLVSATEASQAKLILRRTLDAAGVVADVDDVRGLARRVLLVVGARGDAHADCRTTCGCGNSIAKPVVQTEPAADGAKLEKIQRDARAARKRFRTSGQENKFLGLKVEDE